MHPALHRKNTPSLALNKYLKILVFYFYYFLRIGLNCSTLYSKAIFESIFHERKKLNNQTIECYRKYTS